MRNYFFVLFLLFACISFVMGCSFLNGKNPVQEKKVAGYTSIELQALVKPISDYVSTNVSGKKQSVYYEPGIGKIVIQAEFTDNEVKELNQQFGEELISLKAVDNEWFIGLTPSQDNPFKLTNKLQY